MACEPFDCDKCGQRHERCTGHVDKDEDGEPIPPRPCLKWPRVGAAVCQKHGGEAPQIIAATERRLKEAAIRKEIKQLGLSLEVDPIEAILHELWETAANVEYYRMLVQQLQEDDDGGSAIAAGNSIYGQTYHVSGAATGEAKPHVLVVMYNEERKHLVDVASAAVRLGIEKRRVSLEENRAVEVFRAVTEALTAMGLGERFIEFRQHFSDALSAGRSVSERAGIPSHTD